MASHSSAGAERGPRGASRRTPAGGRPGSRARVRCARHPPPPAARATAASRPHTAGQDREEATDPPGRVAADAQQVAGDAVEQAKHAVAAEAVGEGEPVLQGRVGTRVAGGIGVARRGRTEAAKDARSRMRPSRSVRRAIALADRTAAHRTGRSGAGRSPRARVRGSSGRRRSARPARRAEGRSRRPARGAGCSRRPARRCTPASAGSVGGGPAKRDLDGPARSGGAARRACPRRRAGPRAGSRPGRTAPRPR